MFSRQPYWRGAGIDDANSVRIDPAEAARSQHSEISAEP